LLGNHLYKVFLLNNLLRSGINRWRRSKGWHHSNRGCGDISSIIAILILVFILTTFSLAVKSNLIGDLCDELIARLDLFLQLLSVFPQPLAQGFQLCDFLT
jgi:hypothetical protein